jgi:Holliday junction resolvase RusA-like endonuclease
VITFTVYGKPVAQGRPRAGKTFSGNVVLYDPGKSKNYKQMVGLVAMKHRPPELIKDAVNITVKVFRPIPKSMPKYKREKALKGVLRPTSKPDLSNYIKGIEDAIEGILLANDSQIVSYDGSGKWYSDTPRIEVEIIEVKEEAV